jgi:DNA-binding transcriptional LysR family regulator
LGLDGYTLRTFITVLDESSVSKAAIRLGVNRSAVSHTLDRLRLALDDALFVRVGRGIVTTAKAASLREPVEAIISGLKSLAVPMVDMIRFHSIQSDRRV